MKDQQALIIEWKESSNKFKKGTTGLKCMKTLGDICKSATLVNEEKIPEQITYCIQSNQKRPFRG